MRKKLDRLEIKADNFHDQQAEGLLSMETLREKLAALDTERTELAERLTELSDSEERLRELEALPNLIEEYLRDLPHLLDLKPLLREYETTALEPTEDDPLGGLYTVTPERVRVLSEGELAEKRRAVEEKRARRFRELYAMLGLKVVCHKDRSLEVSWGAHCSEWLGRGPKQAGTTPRLACAPISLPPRSRALLAPTVTALPSLEHYEVESSRVREACQGRRWTNAASWRSGSRSCGPGILSPT